MANDESLNNTESFSFDTSEISLSRTARFWILLLFDIPSILCTFFVLFHLITDRKLRRALNNHVIILLLIAGMGTQFLDVPFYLNFIIHSQVMPSTPGVCLTWWFVAFAVYNGGTILMAWASIERHILVFHDRWVSTRRRRIFSHYLPLAILLLYIFVYYIFVLFIFSCENTYEYSLPVCNAYPCYQTDPMLGNWDFIVNNILPTLLVAIFSLALFIRVIWQKRRRQQPIQWRKQRKMTIQLLSISALNVVCNVPLNLVSLAHLCGLADDYGVEAQQYFYFSCYFLIFLFPFVCLISYTKLNKKIQRILFSRLLRRSEHVATITPACLLSHRTM